MFRYRSLPFLSRLSGPSSHHHTDGRSQSRHGGRQGPRTPTSTTARAGSHQSTSSPPLYNILPSSEPDMTSKLQERQYCEALKAQIIDNARALFVGLNFTITTGLHISPPPSIPPFLANPHTNNNINNINEEEEETHTAHLIEHIDDHNFRPCYDARGASPVEALERLLARVEREVGVLSREIEGVRRASAGGGRAVRVLVRKER